MKTTETMAGRTVKVKRPFAASPERIFDAWLNPQIAGRFLFATPTGEMVRVDIDAGLRRPRAVMTVRSSGSSKLSGEL